MSNIEHALKNKKRNYSKYICQASYNAQTFKNMQNYFNRKIIFTFSNCSLCNNSFKVFLPVSFNIMWLAKCFLSNAFFFFGFFRREHLDTVFQTFAVKLILCTSSFKFIIQLKTSKNNKYDICTRLLCPHCYLGSLSPS